MFWNSVLNASGATVGLIFLFYGSLSSTTVKNSACSVLDRLTQMTLAGVLLSNNEPHKCFCECCFWQSCACIRDDSNRPHTAPENQQNQHIWHFTGQLCHSSNAVNLTSPELILHSGCPETLFFRARLNFIFLHIFIYAISSNLIKYSSNMSKQPSTKHFL